MNKLFPRISVALIFFAVILMLSSCSQPPDEEIMAAEDAIKAAIDAGADELSPNMLNKARNLLQDAKMLNEQGKYSDARKKAEFAVIRAGKAQKNAERLSEAKHERTQQE